MPTVSVTRDRYEITLSGDEKASRLDVDGKPTVADEGRIQLKFSAIGPQTTFDPRLLGSISYSLTLFDTKVPDKWFGDSKRKTREAYVGDAGFERRSEREDRPGEWVELYHFFVDEDWRRHGVGGFIFDVVKGVAAFHGGDFTASVGGGPGMADFLRRKHIPSRAINVTDQLATIGGEKRVTIRSSAEEMLRADPGLSVSRDS